MNIVTLTTDFGWKDYYVGAIKGSILSNGAPVLFVDITHDINNYNIVEAAFIIKNAYPNFPKKTIHLVSVNNFYSSAQRFLAIYHDEHYFIGPDNGVFSLLFDTLPEVIYELPSPRNTHVFSIKDIFAKAVSHIISEKPFHEIGLPIAKILQRLSLQPIIGKSQIRGSAIHIDNYENIIFNIDEKLFNRVGQGRPFELYFKRHDPLTKISKNYAEVPVGDVLCLFNSSGFLEISVNSGKAATLFGIEVDDSIQIDFIDNF